MSNNVEKSCMLNYTDSMGEYVDTNWVNAQNTNRIKKHFLARGAFLLLAPTSLLEGAINTIIQSGAAIGAVCTGGKYTKLNCTAIHVDGARMIVVKPYMNLLQMINPEAKLSVEDEFVVTTYDPSKSSGASSYKGFFISSKGDGLLSDMPNNILPGVARDFRNSRDFMQQSVASRATYGALAIACVVTRAVDGLIGVPAAALSILTAGKFKQLNNLAFRSLQAPAVVNDIFYGVIKVINPWAVAH